MEYNTKRSQLIIPEYGRNIHKMIDYAISVEDRAERNKVAQAIVKVMGQVKPQFKEAEDFIQSLWDHMIIISEFKLDVDSPYPYPDKEELVKPPQKVKYPDNKIKYRHYGKSIESFIEKASKLEDGEEKESFTYYIANMMKKNYLLYNRDSVSDELIYEQLEKLSNGQLKVKDDFSLKSIGSLVGKRSNTSNTKNSGRRSSNGKKGKRNYRKNR